MCPIVNTFVFALGKFQIYFNNPLITTILLCETNKLNFFDYGFSSAILCKVGSLIF